MSVLDLLALCNEFAHRSINSGSTTLVITGWIYPALVHKTKSIYSKYYNSNFKHFELTTVLRGTKTIIEDWKPFYPNSGIRIGHNITGTMIEKYSVGGITEMLEIVASKIALLLVRLPNIKTISGQSGCDSESVDSRPLLQCSPSDIAVLTTSAIYNEEIREDLTKRGIRCGSVQKQTRDSRLIAVDEATHALSFEWPIVIVAAFAPYCRSMINWEYTIAASRAIAKLVVIDISSSKVNTRSDEDAENF